MKTICANCKKYLSGDPEEKENISHGLCKKCIRKLYPEYAEEILRSIEEEAKSRKDKGV